MGAKLLIEDVREIVAKSYRIQESELFDYYSNIIQFHYPLDRRIVDKLKEQIIHYAEWFFNKYKDRERDDFVINMNHYDNLIEIMEIFEDLIKNRKQLFEIERKLPEPIRERIKGLQYNDWDPEDITERLNLLKDELNKYELREAKTEHLNVNRSLEVMPKKRSLDDIALQFIWEGRTITPQNRDFVAAEVGKLYPPTKLKNGVKLYYRYLELEKRTTRVNDQGPKKNKIHYKNMERALKYLSDKNKIEDAKSEILAFKKQAEKVSGQKL